MNCSHFNPVSLARRDLPRFLIGVGVQLTEGFMMDPERSGDGTPRHGVASFQRPKGAVNGSEQHQPSVSALVFHHPDCTYFGVGDAGD